MMDSFIPHFIDLSKAPNYESVLKRQMWDVVLVAGGKEIRAQKELLSARSPVFAAMFAYDTKEAQENRVEITNVDVEMVEMLVRYTYSAKVDNLDRYAEDLWIVADRYLMDCLKSECEQYLSSLVSVSSFSDLLIFADTYHATVLTSKCLDCIVRNVDLMTDSEEWDKIAKTDLLSKIREHLNLCFSEQNYLSLITTESFADLLIFADNYQVIELCIKCLEYIAHNLARLVTSEEFDKIVANADLLDKLCESLNLYFSEGKFAYQISCNSVADLLIFADTYQVIELYMTCLEYVANNFAEVVTSKRWIKIAVRADLLTQLYDQLHLEYSKEIYDNGEKKANSKKKKKPNNCTSVPDLDFEKYLLKYSNLINGKEALTDAILLVGEAELKVHKSILSARSPVFAKMCQPTLTHAMMTELEMFDLLTNNSLFNVCQWLV